MTLENILKDVPKKDWVYHLGHDGPREAFNGHPGRFPCAPTSTCFKPVTVKVNCQRARHTITVYPSGKIELHDHSRKTRKQDESFVFFGGRCRCSEIRDSWHELMRNPDSSSYKALPTKLVQFARARRDLVKRRRTYQRRCSQISMRIATQGCEPLQNRLTIFSSKHYSAALTRCTTKELRQSYMVRSPAWRKKMHAYRTARWRKSSRKLGLDEAWLKLPDDWFGSNVWRSEHGAVHAVPKAVPCFVEYAHYVEDSDEVPVVLHCFGWDALSTKRQDFSPWSMEPRSLTGWAYRGELGRWLVKINPYELDAIEKLGLSAFASEQHLLWYMRRLGRSK